MLLQSLIGCKNLVDLSLNENSIKGEAYAQLIETVEHLESLERLSLRECKLGEDSPQLKKFLIML